MKNLIKKAVTNILNQLQDKHWQYPIYQLVLSANGGMIFGKYNMDGSFEHLVGEEPVGIIGYPVTLVLIDSQGETVRANIEVDGYKFSEN